MRKEKTILDLYNCNKGNFESIPMSKEQSDALNELADQDNKMRELLKDSKLLEQYDKTTDCFDALGTEAATDNFIEGFKIGFLIALDIFK